MQLIPRRWGISAWALLIVLSIAAVSSTWTNQAQAQVTITKVPVNAATQFFDPRRPPRNMPLLTPPEEAVCASDFPSDASVGGQAMQRDAIHGKLTINQIKVPLQLNITIWLPTNPPKTTVDHEDGHRQVSEYYYRNADMVTRRIAERYAVYG